jgi:hypothetical protein
MVMKKTGLLMVIAIAFTGCHLTSKQTADKNSEDEKVPTEPISIPVPDPPNANAFILKIDGDYHQYKEMVSVNFEKVVNDSRCPTDANCVWEGNAEIMLNVVSMEKDTAHFSLNTQKNYQQDTILNGYTIQLINVLPEPLSGKLLTTDDYSVELKINQQ